MVLLLSVPVSTALETGFFVLFCFIDFLKSFFVIIPVSCLELGLSARDI